jgi:N-acetylglucosaminyl-diphospho-decaprenol L-rhamnosyltransferase
VSVCAVIVSYRTGPALASCMNTLFAAQGLDQIVIADNGNDAAAQALLDFSAVSDRRVLILRGQGNIGFAAACNLAAKEARTDALAFINPDVVLERDAIPRLLAVLNATAPAIVGGDLRDEKGRPERGSRRDRLTLWRAFVSFSGLSRLGFRDYNRHNDPLPTAPECVGAISGALFVVRNSDFAALGGFDEGYFLHVEDVDLCRRAEEQGWQVLFAPGPHGVHLRSSSQAPAAHIAAYKARGLGRYFSKFARNPLEYALGRLVAAVLLAVASLKAAAP